MDKRTMFGRTLITSPELEINKDNVVEVLNQSLISHVKNQNEIEYLFQYYKGNQPVLERIKQIRPEICNKIVENHAAEIVDFKKGYVFGEPIQYVRRNETTKVNYIPELNEYMFIADKAGKDKEIAEWFYICGTSYRLIIPSQEQEIPFEIYTLDPRNTFVVYNSGFKHYPLMGVTFSVNNENQVVYSIYTSTEYFEIVSNIITKQESHALKYIPIIEYPANNSRIGAFEMVLPLLDAINNVISNRLDGIEQFIQSFIKFVNCDIDEETFIALKELGALKVRGDPGNPVSVDLISQELNQTQTQLVKDDIYNTILIICGMPDRQQNAKSTSDTGMAVLLRDGWGDAESRAKETELMFKSSEKQFLKIVLRILKDTVGLDISLNEIDIKFTRNKASNLLVKTQGLSNMLSCGIHPLIAISTCELFSDSEQVYLDSKEYLEKWKPENKAEKPLKNTNGEIRLSTNNNE